MKRFYFTFLVAFLSGSISLIAQQKEVPYVILISFDGFRYDYVKNFNPPNFKAFIQNGSQAEALIPSFPSKTFPNHYTLVTGLTPGNHGLVDNGFYDRARHATYEMKDKAKVADPYYYGGVSLWELARQNGMKSASYFWVGSELTDEKRRPDYYYEFDDKLNPRKRIDQTVAWLKLPEKERPHLITLYFSFPDHEGHMFGPKSLEAKDAVLRADSLLGDLMKGLQSVKFPVNVVIVSDHGMRELTAKPETFIFMDELITKKDTAITIVDGGTQQHIYVTNKKKRDSLYSYLKASEKYFKVYKKEDFPDRWKYKVDRAGEILLEADTSHYFSSAPRERFLKTLKMRGSFGVHGYDPDAIKDVRGIFYAQGPNVKKGITLPPFQNIHVFPFIAEILGLPLPPIDGKQEVLQKIYQN